ncbi:MAG TPA: hypothetical protein VH500_05530 [Nitrososphaeraceae archaeon]|jgi:hypothetical protein
MKQMNAEVLPEHKSKISKYVAMIVLFSSLAVVVELGSIVIQQKVSAFPHAEIVIVPDINDPNQEHAKPIAVVLGHSNEPTFGVSPGVHDGKHAVEVFLSDNATNLPISGAQLSVDKYYFKNYDNFAAATSPNEADDIKTNVPLTEAFGDKGHYLSRQIQQPGIYGYKLTGKINYFDVGEVPISETVFCSIPGKDTSKFNSEGWFGGFGCTDQIQDIYFPSTTTQAQMQSRPSGADGESSDREAPITIQMVLPTSD